MGASKRCFTLMGSDFTFKHQTGLARDKQSSLLGTFINFSRKIFLNVGLSGLYYKTIMIVIMTIVSDATIWSVTYDRN